MLSPNWAARGAREELRSSARAKEWGNGERLGTQSLRSVAGLALVETGGSVPQLLHSGQMHSSAYQLYPGLGREESRANASVIIEASDEDHVPDRMVEPPGAPGYAESQH